jgi:hypothetical protein
MGITIVNKTIIPINIVVMQLAVLTPVGYGRHMNVPPGGSVKLDIGSINFKQFKVYCWCGGSPGTEISVNKIEGYIALRLGATAATLGAHEAFQTAAEAACLDVCQEFVLSHLANEIITTSAFEAAIAASFSFALRGVVDMVVRPKEFGVCREWFASAFKNKVRYVHGGPMIADGKIGKGTKLYLCKWAGSFDPVKALKEL